MAITPPDNLSNVPTTATIAYTTPPAVSFDSITEQVLDGSGHFDKLMTTLRLHINKAVKSGEITQSEAGQVYTGVIPSLVQESVRFELSRYTANEQIEKEHIATHIANNTKLNKIQSSELAYMIADASKNYKVQLAKYQAETSLAAANLSIGQLKGLEEQIIDNRYIKAINSLSDTYGTFGAGGLTVSDDQWAFYYKLIGNLVEDLRDFKGSWDATTVFPGDVDGVFGDFWVVSVDGDIEVDGISGWLTGSASPLRNPDIVFYDGAKWKKISGEIMNTTVAKVVAV